MPCRSLRAWVSLAISQHACNIEEEVNAAVARSIDRGRNVVHRLRVAEIRVHGDHAPTVEGAKPCYVRRSLAAPS